MKKLFTTFLFTLLISMTLAGADREIEVRPASDVLLEANPNQNITTVIFVANHSGQDHEFISDVELPPGWKLITQEFPFELADEKSDLKLLSFFVPQGTSVGQYTVTYRMRSRKYPSVSGYFVLPVQVREYREYGMEIWNAPEMVIAGEAIDFTLLIRNLSNVTDSLTIQGSNNQECKMSLDPASFRLAPGASRQVDVHIVTDQGLSYSLNNFIQFSLFSVVSQKTVVTATVSVQVISRIQGSDDLYFRLPVEVTAAYVAQKVEGKSASGFQGEITGAGFFDQKNVHQIKFHLRGPDAYQKALSIYAERDEYMAEYHNDRIFVAAGDRNFSLSTLTQYSSYGRGAEIGFSLTPNWHFGVFHQQNRWFITKIKSLAGFARYQAMPGLVLQANIIDIEQMKRSGTILGLEGNGQWNQYKMNLEYAATRNDHGVESAVDAGFSGNHEKVSYNIRWIYADPQFIGYFKDTNYLSTSLSVIPIRRAGIHVQYRFEKQNFNLDTTRFDAPLTRYFETGVHYDFTEKAQVTLDYIRQSRKDRLNSLFDYTETSVRLRMNMGLGPFALSASAEGGETVNTLYDRNASMMRYTASVFYTPSSWQNYRGFMFWDENNRYTGDKRRMLTAGFQMNYILNQKLQMMLSLQNNHSPEEYYYDRNQAELLFKYILPNHHTIQIRGRQTFLKNSLNRTDKAIVAEYHAPFGIPLSRKPNTCIVRGKIYDAQSQKPLSDLIVRINGSTAVTDKNGVFLFRNLREKEYFITIDKSTMGLNRVTLQRTPLPVTTIEGKDGLYIEIGVVDGASLSGRVLLQSQPSPQGTDEEGFVVGSGSSVSTDTATCEGGDHGLANIVVEMRKGDEVLRRLTDANGNYEFEELRPGRWTIQFYKQNLPAYHQFEQDLFEIEIEPGQSEFLNACVVPQKRRIQFLQGGGQVLHEKFKTNYSHQ